MEGASLDRTGTSRLAVGDAAESLRTTIGARFMPWAVGRGSPRAYGDQGTCEGQEPWLIVVLVL